MARGRQHLNISFSERRLTNSKSPTMAPTMFQGNAQISGDHATFYQGRDFHVYHGSGGNREPFDLLVEKVATGAFHNSGELCDAPKCHPGTRVAIINSIITWAAATSYTFCIQWLHGPAGAGKSAILRTLAEIFEKQGLLLASFFFFRAASGRNTAEFLIPTIAYQICRSIPQARRHVEEAVRLDPLIFKQSIEAQAQALIVLPLTRAYEEGITSSACPRVIVIDGLDECQDESRQCEVLKALSSVVHELHCPIAVLIASRPEHHIRHAFDIGRLNQASSRLALDESYEPDKDIRKYYNDKFDNIRHYHPLRSSLPESWPPASIIEFLVEKASGQFIFSSTIIKFVEPHRHDPSQRLNMIIGFISPGKLKPFKQLDALYSAIFATVDPDDIDPLLHLLGVLLVPHIEERVFWPLKCSSILFLEQFTGFAASKIKYLIFDLGSLLEIKYEENTTRTELHVYHASLSDFLFDRHRSRKFFIDSEKVYQFLSKRCVNLLFSTTDKDTIRYIEINLGLHLQWANFSNQRLPTPISASTLSQTAPLDYVYRLHDRPQWLHSLPHLEVMNLCPGLVAVHKNYVQSKVEVYFERKLTPLLVLLLERFDGSTQAPEGRNDIEVCFEDPFRPPHWVAWLNYFMDTHLEKPDAQYGLSLLTLLKREGATPRHRTCHFGSGSALHALVMESVGIRLSDCYADFSLYILNRLIHAPRWINYYCGPHSMPFQADPINSSYSSLIFAPIILPSLLLKSSPHPDIIRTIKHDFTPSTHPSFPAHDQLQGYLLKWEPKPSRPIQHPGQDITDPAAGILKSLRDAGLLDPAEEEMWAKWET